MFQPLFGQKSSRRETYFFCWGAEREVIKRKNIIVEIAGVEYLN